MPNNKVAQFRLQKKITLNELARGVGVSRQSLHAIEAGEQVPKVYLAIGIARFLGVDVAEVFPDGDGGSLRIAVLATGHKLSRVCLSEIDGETVVRESSYAGFGSVTAPADAVVRIRDGHFEVESDSGRSGLFVDGCDPVLGVLAARSLESQGCPKVRWFYGSNKESLGKLRDGFTHCALVHDDVEHLEDDIGEARDAVATPFGEWELALTYLPGNPKQVRSMEDLLRSDIVFASREEGSGVRHFLEYSLASLGLDGAILDRAMTFNNHFQVAAAVGLGLCDAGVMPISIAQSHGLGYLPVGVHRSSLVFSREGYQRAVGGGLFDLMATASFSREVSALGGYRLVG